MKTIWQQWVDESARHREMTQYLIKRTGDNAPMLSVDAEDREPITDAPPENEPKTIWQEWEDEDLLNLAAGYPDDNPKTALGEAKPKISSTPTIGIREMGKVFELGARKYGRYNWRLHNVSATVYYDAAWRHLSAWFDGENADPESGVSHLAHVMACMTILLDAEAHQTMNDNRLNAEEKGGA
jgi:hypothetical protein